MLPLLALALVNTCAVLYFAVLLRYLPAKREAPPPSLSDAQSDTETLVRHDRSEIEADRV